MSNNTPHVHKAIKHEWCISDMTLVMDVYNKTVWISEDSTDQATLELEFVGRLSDRDENQVRFLRDIAACLLEAADIWEEAYPSTGLKSLGGSA